MPKDARTSQQPPDTHGNRIPDDDLLRDLQRVADVVDRPPTIREYREHGAHSVPTLSSRFGSWTHALAEAGFDPEAGRTHPGKKLSESELHQDIRRVASNLGHPPNSSQYDEHGEHSTSTVFNRYDSWRAALEAAGLNPDNCQRGDPESSMLVACVACGTTMRAQSDRFRCRDCGRRNEFEIARVAYLRASKPIRQLAKGPTSRSDLQHSTSAHVKQAIRRLKAPARGSGGFKPRPGSGAHHSICYLPGQERQAVTRFIEDNTEYVRSCLADQQNPLRRNWPDDRYLLLIEQWHWLGYPEAQEADTDA